MNKFCCKQFEDQVSEVQFEKLEDGEWAINGCCGGGCYVVSAINFCPFCGADLMKQNE